jgi:deazaflavin-dependent oxidoreductase (nitroreductase family)
MTSIDSPATEPSTQEAVQAALATGGVIDITTHGRTSGEPRRIEIVFFNLGGLVVISGMPGKRGWYANLKADPHFTFHLKSGVQADLPARATLITDPDERRALLVPITRQWKREAQLDRFLADSPLVEVTFDDPSLAA